MFSTTIDRNPDVVFDYLADVSRHSEWSPKPFRVEGVTGPVRAGDTFVSVGSIPGDKNHRNAVTVTECSPPRRLVLTSTEESEHFVNTFELEALGPGTRLTRIVDAPRPKFPLSVVFPLVMAVVIRPDVDKGLRTLKGMLERT
ncbi:MAG: SRPBCC family protein [Motilibacteraceae bacterium]